MYISILLFISILIVAILTGLLTGYLVGIKTEQPETNGYLEVSENDTSQIHRLDIVTPPEELKNLSRVVFKVRKVPSNSEASQG